MIFVWEIVFGDLQLISKKSNPCRIIQIVPQIDG